VAKAGRELSGSNEEVIAAAIDDLREKYGLIAPRLQALLDRIRQKGTDTPNG